METKNKEEMSYTATFPLFKDLNEHEVKEFKECAREFCMNGFHFDKLEIVHPIIRNEIVRIIITSLVEQNELTAQFTPKHMDKLFHYEYWLDGHEFRTAFTKHGGTEHLAQHLWDKFHGTYKHSILNLWRSLDNDNRKMLLKMINEEVESKQK